MTDFTPRPILPMAFTGRTRELGYLLEKTMIEGPPLVSLVGPCRIGRTSYLLKVQDLARTSATDTEYARLFSEDKRLVTPFIDIRQFVGLERIPDAQHAKDALACIIGAEMEHRDLKPPSKDDISQPGGLEALIATMAKVSDEVSFMLLVDSAEFLPRDGALDPEDPFGEVVATIEKLTQAVESFGLVLSFGVGGEMRKRTTAERDSEYRAIVLTISRSLTLSLDTIELGLLSSEEVSAYASARFINLANGEIDRPTASEVKWLCELAGGHPYVLNMAGQQVRQRREGCTEEEAETALDKSMDVFAADIARRFDTVTGAREAAYSLALSPGGMQLPAHLAELLVREGVATMTSAQDGLARAHMPSRAIRRAFLNLEASQLQPAVGVTSAVAGSTNAPPMSVWLIDADGEVQSVRVTASECDLLERLIAAPHIVSPDELLAVLGPSVTSKQLTQRLSVLRTKLSEGLGIPNPIISVYKQGYRWVASPAIRLRRE